MREAPASTRRTTFYDELVRRRRAAWIVASICALVAAGVGLVLSTIVTPIVLLVLGGLLKLVAALGVAGGGAQRPVPEPGSLDSAPGRCHHALEVLDRHGEVGGAPA